MATTSSFVSRNTRRAVAAVNRCACASTGAPDDQLNGRIQRIVLDDRKHAARPQHAPDVGGQRDPRPRIDVMVINVPSGRRFALVRLK